MSLSKIVQESADSWRDFFIEKSKHCEQKYLTADTNGIVKDYLISSQISLLVAELEKLKEVEVSCVDDRLLGKSDEYLDGYNTSTDRWRQQRDNYITYLTEQIELIKKMV